MEGLACLIAIVSILCIIVLPIITLCNICSLRNELEELKRQLGGGKVAGAEARQPENENQPEKSVGVAGLCARKPEAVQLAPEPEPVAEPTPEPAPAAEPIPEEPPTAVEVLFAQIGDWLAVRGRFAPEGVTREFAFVTRWLVRLGAVLLVGCLVYFMKLSVDRGWVGPVGRTVAMIVWGAVFAAAGAWVVRKTRYAPVGHAVAGLGFVAMYLGFGLGHRMFNPPVIPSAGFAFAALAAVTVMAGVYAVRLPSAMVAVLGLVGGYLVPVIAGKDSGNPVGLYVYLLMLDAAAVYVAHLRRWSALNFLSAALAFAMCAVWQDRHPMAPHWMYYCSFAFLSCVHLAYLGATIAGSRLRGKAGNAIAWTGLALNAAGYLTWILVVLRPIADDGLTGLMFLGTVAVYAVAARVAIRRGWADIVTVQMMLLFAFAYLAVAPLMIVARPYLVFAWCAIAAASGEAGRRSRQPILGYLGLTLVALAALMAFTQMADGAYAADDPAMGMGYFGGMLLRIVRFWCVPAALGAFAWRRWCAAGSRGVVAALWSLAAACGFIFLTDEAWLFGLEYLPDLKGGSVTMVWGLTGIGALVAGVMGRVKAVRITSLVLLGVTVAKLLFVDTGHLATPYRVLTFGLTGVVLLVGAVVYLKFKERFESNEK